jgi:myosin V
MAENVYSKGTRVWFVDKEQAWISAEVTSVTRGAEDTIKLVFVDERGKARSSLTSCLVLADDMYHRKSLLTRLLRI